MRLLLAEDEREYSRAVCELLRRAQYSVDVAADGLTALEYARSGRYDGLLLDIRMPEMDGLTVLRTLRAEGCQTPVLMLTACGGVDERIGGLDAGADDYLPKPFDGRELLARVRALLRRSDSFQPQCLRFGDLSLDDHAHSLSGPGGQLRLLGREYQMMELFMRNPRIVFSTERLMERLWGWDSEAELNVVWTTISKLRRHLAEVGSAAEIRARRGVGYSLEGTWE